MSFLTSLLRVGPQLVGAKLSRSCGTAAPAPINLTLSVTNRCNSRCLSCDIWKIYPAEKERLRDELSIDEIEALFLGIGPVYFFNISGGEPFLRSDLDQIVRLACIHLRPSVVHIPTNGLNPARVEAMTRRILSGMREWAPDTKLTLKPSFDGVGAEHDRVRGVKGNYDRLLETLARLGRVKEEEPRLYLGVGTVISEMNRTHLPEIVATASTFQVDTYISEVAEEREEMRNLGSGITPSAEDYWEAVRPLRERTRAMLSTSRGMDRLTMAMRHEYYELTRDWIEMRTQVLPCYAGLTNAHISAYGELWACAVLGDQGSLGNLREAGFDFWKVWQSPQAREVRASIKRGDCDCPLANQAYANMLLAPEAMTKVAGRMLQAEVERRRSRQCE